MPYLFLILDAPPAADGTPRKLIRFGAEQTELAHYLHVLLSLIAGETLPTQCTDRDFYPLEFYLPLTPAAQQAVRVFAGWGRRLEGEGEATDRPAG